MEFESHIPPNEKVIWDTLYTTIYVDIMHQLFLSWFRRHFNYATMSFANRIFFWMKLHYEERAPNTEYELSVKFGSHSKTYFSFLIIWTTDNCSCELRPLHHHLILLHGFGYMRSLTRPNENEWMDEWNIWRWFILPLFLLLCLFFFVASRFYAENEAMNCGACHRIHILCRLLNWTEEIDYSNVRRPLTFSTILSFNQFIWQALTVLLYVKRHDQ